MSCIIRRLYDIAAGDGQLISELIDAFLYQYPRQLDDLREAIEASNCEQIGRMAHRIKGSLINMGAEDAGRLAYRLECSDETKNPPMMQDAFDHLCSVCAEVADLFRLYQQTLNTEGGVRGTDPDIENLTGNTQGQLL